jgi:quinol monooxygenase YgiN
MLTFKLHMEFTPQTCDEAAGVLRSLVGPVRAEAGCSATQLLRDTEDGYGLTWVEEWRGVEDFERHLRGVAFRRILAVIELAAGPPAVEIDDVASRRGFELVEEILGQTQVNQAERKTG